MGRKVDGSCRHRARVISGLRVVLMKRRPFAWKNSLITALYERMHSAIARCNFRDRAARILLRAEMTDNRKNVVVAHCNTGEYSRRATLVSILLLYASRICYRRYGHVSRTLPLFPLNLCLCEHMRFHCASEARVHADIAVAFAWDIDCVVKDMNECWNAWLRNISRHATLHEFYPEKGNAIGKCHEKRWKYCQLQIWLPWTL